MPFDFSQIVAPFRMQPGLRRVAPGAAQLTPTWPGGRHVREKMAVLARFAAQALVAAEGVDPAPVLCALAAEASQAESPGFRRESDGGFAAPRLGWRVREGRVEGDGDPAIGELLRALPPELRATALLCLAFEEDFAVIDGNDATIPWLAVCLPSRWAPEDKVGRHFAEVHAPVADSELLIAAGAQLARLVSGNDRWERFVWTVSPDLRLDQHPARAAAAWPPRADAEAIGEFAVLRHEHQTFVPMVDSRRAVFTIRVESEPLAAALVVRDDALRLHAALWSMTPAVLAYRGLDAVVGRLLEWLSRRAAVLPPAAP